MRPPPRPQQPERTCRNCGAPVRVPFRAPPAELAPDLDLRPGEPTRSTLRNWVQTCRRCGASGPDLATLPSEVAEVVPTPAYQALRGPEPDKPFLRWAAVAAAAGLRTEAAEATLQAAWALDDAGSDASAHRRGAAALWGTPLDVEGALRLVDILRRAGDWDAALAHADALGTAPDENSARILDFQRARIVERDSGRHLMSSALRPPARTPHVSHGKPSAGLWRRLFGG